MESKRLAQDLARLYSRKGYSWRVDGTMIVPKSKDIEDVIKRVEEHMLDLPDGSRFEVGRMIFIKTANKIDVYVLYGTINDEKSDV